MQDAGYWIIITIVVKLRYKGKKKNVGVMEIHNLKY